MPRKKHVTVHVEDPLVLGGGRTDAYRRVPFVNNGKEDPWTGRQLEEARPCAESTMSSSFRKKKAAKPQRKVSNLAK